MKMLGAFRGRSDKSGWVFFVLLALGLAFCSGCSHPRTKYTPIAYAEGPAISPAPAKEPAAAQPQMTRLTVTNRLDPAWLKQPVDLFTLGPGDKLELEILGDAASRVTTMVAPDGKIYFNLLGGVEVWGLTLPQAKARLEDEFGKFNRDKPQVGMILRGVESKRIWILGRVQAPGVYAMAGPMTVLEAVSMAGGTLTMANYRDQEAAGVSEEMADLSRSFIIRQGKLLPVDFRRLLYDGDLAQNIYLQPDDFIYLSAATAREVYILGAVAQPRSVAYTEGLTVAGAVASAYGTIKGAYMHHVAVVRGSLSQPEITIVDYKDVIQGKAQDLALQPHDIVYVPFSPYRYLTKYVELVLNTFVSSAAINAGSQAVSKPNTGGAGVFIPVGSGVSIIPPVNPPPIH